MTEDTEAKKEINGTKIMIPDVPKKSDSRYQRLKKHMLFCKRAGIEPTIGHLKSDYRLGRNFYKGVVGDAVNVLLSRQEHITSKRAMKALLGMLQKICEILCLNNISQKWAFKGRLITIEHTYPRFHLKMHCFICSIASGTIELIEHKSAKWLTENELESVEWLPADEVAISQLLKLDLQ